MNVESVIGKVIIIAYMSKGKIQMDIVNKTVEKLQEELESCIQTLIKASVAANITQDIVVGNLVDRKLTIPKSIADALDKVPFHNPIAQLSNKDCDLTDFNDTVKRYAWNNKENGYICVAYIAGKTLGVDLVKVVEG